MQSNTLSPRDLILTLIDSAASPTLTARYFVAAGDLFELDSGSMRVALARLVKEGALRQPERGTYALDSRAGTLHRLVRNWAQIESSVKPWDETWLAVYVAHLPRSAKTQLRARERALRLFGFAEVHTGLWIRPDNLVMPIAELHLGLQDLGLDPAAMLFQLDNPRPDILSQNDLWPRAQLEQGYQDNINALAASTERLSNYSATQTAREVLALGRRVTRSILLDPLLPAELINVQLRQQMVNDMRAYDRLARPYWRKLYRQYN